MTLLIFARGNDGFVIISDRKESEGIGQGNEVQKYYLPENKEFFLTLAGDGAIPQHLFASLADKNVDSTNIRTTIQSFIQATFTELQEQSVANGFFSAEGFLVIKNGGNFKLYTVRILKDKFTPSVNDSGFFTIGDYEAKLIIEHLIRNINFSDLSCENVAKRLLAAISDVAETVSSVGHLERFGFDVAAFMNSGEIIRRERYTDTRNRLKISFELSTNKIFLHSSHNEDDNDE